MLTREEKSEILDEISDLWKNSKSMVFYNFNKMLSNEIVDFRKTIKSSGAKVFVFKNTLIKLGAKRAGITISDVDSLIFTNQTGLITTEGDPLNAPKLVTEIFYKKGKPKIKGGFFEGRFINSDQVKQLASISSREEIYQRLAYTMASPITKLACSLNNVLVNLLTVLNAVKNKKEEIN